MTATPIRAGVTANPEKQQFLDYVAQQYDAFTDRYGTVPSGIVFGYTNDSGDPSASWLFVNHEAGNMCSMLLSNVAVHILHQAMKG